MDYNSTRYVVMRRRHGIANGNSERNFILWKSARAGNVPLVLQCLSSEGQYDKADLEFVHHKEGGTPLFVAVFHGREAVVSVLINSGANVNAARNTDGATPLCVASYKGYLSIAKLLIQNNADIGATTHNNRTPLHFASQKGHLDIVKLLVQHKANVNATTSNGFTPLFCAAHNGKRDVVKYLLDHGAQVDVPRAKDGATALLVAAYKGYAGIVKDLLLHRADPNKSLNSNNDSKSPLFVAAAKGYPKIVKLLLHNKADPNCQLKSDRRTPLYVASMKGYVEIVKMLLNFKANTNCTCGNDNRTPLFAASQQGHLEVVRILLDHNAAVDGVTTDDRSPLFVASFRGHLEVVKLLLSRRANPNYECEDDGTTPLFAATKEGHTKVMKVLIEHGAAVDCVRKKEGTPLIVAAKMGSREPVELLLANGADVNWTPDPSEDFKFKPMGLLDDSSEDDESDEEIPMKIKTPKKKRCVATALHAAVENRRAEVVKLLLSRDDILWSLKNRNKQTALDIAKEKEYKEIVAIFAGPELKRKTVCRGCNATKVKLETCKTCEFRFCKNCWKQRTQILAGECQQCTDRNKIDVVEKTVVGSEGDSTLVTCTWKRKNYAAKFIRVEADKSHKKILKNEVESLKRLNHHNILPVFDALFRDRTVIILMSELDCSLAAWLAANRQKNRYPSSKCVLWIFGEVVKGVHYLHTQPRPIPHKNIKPDNILLSIENEEESDKKKKKRDKSKKSDEDDDAIKGVYLSDFGLTRESPKSSYKKYFTASRWQPPEVFKTYGKLSDIDTALKADIWAIGCVLFSLLTMVNPYQDITEEHVAEHVKEGRPEIEPLLHSIPKDIRNDLLWTQLIYIYKKCTRELPSKRPYTTQLLTWIDMLNEGQLLTEKSIISSKKKHKQEERTEKKKKTVFRQFYEVVVGGHSTHEMTSVHMYY